MSHSLSRAPSPDASGVDLARIREAARLLRGAVVATPSVPSPGLSQRADAEVVLKLENRQITGSFKPRGALVKLLSLAPEQRRAGVIAMSAGNHAQGVAYHARRLSIPSVIAMPRFTPNVKVDQTRALGAEIVLEGDTLDETGRVARRLARERGLALVHPYDDEHVIAGQGTVALEMLEADPQLDALIVPVGGGGLIAGCAVAARALAPRARVVGVQSARFPSMLRALAGEPLDCGRSTLAEGIAVKRPGRKTLPLVREFVDEILLVDEDAIEDAVRLLLELEKSVVEGAGAAPLAALLAHPARFAGRRVGLVLSGGNIDSALLSLILQRGLARSGRLVRLVVEARDVPGELARITGCVSAAGASIAEVHHQRAFTSLSLESAEVELVLHARGRDHVDEILERLREAGLSARLG